MEKCVKCGIQMDRDKGAIVVCSTCAKEGFKLEPFVSAYAGVERSKEMPWRTGVTTREQRDAVDKEIQAAERRSAERMLACCNNWIYEAEGFFLDDGLRFENIWQDWQQQTEQEKKR